MVKSCLLIILIKGHKSLGSLCSVVKTLIVSGADQGTDRQGHLLSCSGKQKNITPNNVSYIVSSLWDVFLVSNIDHMFSFQIQNLKYTQT